MGYFRESGRFVVFRAKAVVLATGGIGQCWEINSNSWEYTADGHALALWAGADLIDMEFVQFHPTGMVWPPSVRGTLITEGVRGEGGVLLNGERKRFMFEYIPDRYKGEFAETEEEATRWVQAVIAGKRPEARRPPELLTRDVVARAIRAEVRAGRGTPHGGVYLDIASRRTPEEIKRKLPGMYHQFKELADVDITDRADGGRPHLPLHDGGRARRPGNAGIDRAGPVRRRRSGRRAARRESAGGQLALGPAGVRQAGRRVRRRAGPRDARVATHRRGRNRARGPGVARPAGAGRRARTPTPCTRSCSSSCSGTWASSAPRPICEEALVKLADLRARAAGVKCGGNIQFNPGWHLGLDLANMLDISEAVVRAALERQESRAAHTREDFPDASPEWGKVNLIVRQTAAGIEVQREPLPQLPAELAAIVKGK